MIRFGYSAPLEYIYDVEEILRQGVLAEKFGFDSLFLSDHFHPWFSDGYAAMVWPVMTAIAAKTRLLSPISTTATCPIIRYNPAIIAQVIATLSVMYPNRIALGVGAGEALNEYPPTGEWPNPRQRLDMLTEAVYVIKQLWENDKPINFKGDYYQLFKAKLYTKPKNKIPLYFAAGGAKSCELAGRHGDHWITGSTSIERLVNVLFPALKKGVEAAGKNLDEMDKVLASCIALDESFEKAITACKPFCGSLVPGIFKYKMYDPEEIKNQATNISEDTITDNFIIAIQPDEIIEKLEKYAKAGINHFCIANVGPDVDRCIKIMGEKVIPYFKNIKE